jgi:hypothetical protein
VGERILGGILIAAIGLTDTELSACPISQVELLLPAAFHFTKLPRFSTIAAVYQPGRANLRGFLGCRT